MNREELLVENRELRKLVQEYKSQLQAIKDYIEFYEKERKVKK